MLSSFKEKTLQDQIGENHRKNILMRTIRSPDMCKRYLQCLQNWITSTKITCTYFSFLFLTCKTLNMLIKFIPL